MLSRLQQILNAAIFIFLVGFIGFEMWSLGSYLMRTYLLS